MAKHQINPTLFDVAQWRLDGEAEKQAFVPQGATDPAAGGMPPGGGPMAAGGMPPGGDPMAAGMPPGGDPMAAGGMPPAAPPAAPAQAPAAPAQGGGQGTGGKPKIDPTFIYMELSRVRKLLTHMMRHAGIEMPDDILDDGAVAMVAQGQTPQSSPLGQGGPAEAGGQAGLPALGGAGPINPIQPAGDGGGGGSEKPAHDVMSLFRGPWPAGDQPDFAQLGSRIDALSALSRSLQEG